MPCVSRVAALCGTIVPMLVPHLAAAHALASARPFANTGELDDNIPDTAPSAGGGITSWSGGLTLQYAVPAEVLWPLNGVAGHTIGAVAQLHLYFDDLMPNTLGKPISEW